MADVHSATKIASQMCIAQGSDQDGGIELAMKISLRSPPTVKVAAVRFLGGCHSTACVYAACGLLRAFCRELPVPQQHGFDMSALTAL